jgi:hypothetical protein
MTQSKRKRALLERPACYSILRSIEAGKDGQNSRCIVFTGRNGGDFRIEGVKTTQSSWGLAQQRTRDPAARASWRKERMNHRLAPGFGLRPPREDTGSLKPSLASMLCFDLRGERITATSRTIPHAPTWVG